MTTKPKQKKKDLTKRQKEVILGGFFALKALVTRLVPLTEDCCNLFAVGFKKVTFIFHAFYPIKMSGV